MNRLHESVDVNDKRGTFNTWVDWDSKSADPQAT